MNRKIIKTLTFFKSISSKKIVAQYPIETIERFPNKLYVLKIQTEKIEKLYTKVEKIEESIISDKTDALRLSNS